MFRLSALTVSSIVAISSIVAHIAPAQAQRQIVCADGKTTTHCTLLINGKVQSSTMVRGNRSTRVIRKDAQPQQPKPQPKTKSSRKNDDRPKLPRPICPGNGNGQNTHEPNPDWGHPKGCKGCSGSGTRLRR